MRVIHANSSSRQIAIPASPVASKVSRPRKNVVASGSNSAAAPPVREKLGHVGLFHEPVSRDHPEDSLSELVNLCLILVRDFGISWG